jgi:hypothetical protein
LMVYVKATPAKTPGEHWRQATSLMFGVLEAAARPPHSPRPFTSQQRLGLRPQRSEIRRE